VSVVREHIEQLAGWIPDSGMSKINRWLLDNGRDWRYEDRPLPADVERGPFKNCYENAGIRVLDDGVGGGADSEYRYVEGMAWCGTIPVSHAWLVDSEDRVVDPTWIHDGVCGFCLGDGEEDGDCECDDPDGDCWGCEPERVTCRWCEGTGRDANADRDSSEREYFGVVIDAGDLRRHLIETRSWGCLTDAEWYVRLGVL
jgi:hypothetical protein